VLAAVLGLEGFPEQLASLRAWSRSGRKQRNGTEIRAPLGQERAPFSVFRHSHRTVDWPRSMLPHVTFPKVVNCRLELLAFGDAADCSDWLGLRTARRISFCTPQFLDCGAEHQTSDLIERRCPRVADEHPATPPSRLPKHCGTEVPVIRAHGINVIALRLGSRGRFFGSIASYRALLRWCSLMMGFEKADPKVLGGIN
jgi:hypothetical protein